MAFHADRSHHHAADPRRCTGKHAAVVRGSAALYGDDVLLVTGPPLGPEGSLLERARASGVPVEVLPALRRKIHPCAIGKATAQIKRAIRDFEPDVVHTHSGKAGLLGRTAAHALGCRRSCTRYTARRFIRIRAGGRGAVSRLRALRRTAMRRAGERGRRDDRFDGRRRRAPSGRSSRPSTAAWKSSRFCGPTNTARPCAARLGYRDEHVVVGKIARLFHLKGHEYVVAAARRAVGRNPNLRFLLVGDGILTETIRDQVRQARLDDYFQFTGLVPPEDIPPLIGAMDIVVHTSLREGLARVLPQALIAGKPVVSYDVDGAREVVITDETGILLPPLAWMNCRRPSCALAADRAAAPPSGKLRPRAIYRAVSPRADDRAIAGPLRADSRGEAGGRVGTLSPGVCAGPSQSLSLRISWTLGFTVRALAGAPLFAVRCECPNLWPRANISVPTGSSA